MKSQNPQIKQIVIIGNGISGITAARHIRKNSNNEIYVISDETEYFFSRTALMYVFMGHMPFNDTKPYEDHFWKKNNINLIFDRVEDIDFSQKNLQLKKGNKLNYDKLILAVGSKPNKFGWIGQDLKAVQGLYSKKDLDDLESWTKSIKTAVVVGGGLIGVELAEMLVSRNINVTFLVRENTFWGNVLPEQESKLITKHIQKHAIDLRLNQELEEIIGDNTGRVQAVKTKSGERVDCQFVGLTAGVSPNIDFLKNHKELKTDRGILINLHFETSVEDVYAIGDCAQFVDPPFGRKSIEQVWYTGRIMGETLAQIICGNKIKYQPGPWFNSAKFFDVEYQTYGVVNTKCAEDEDEFYWEHANSEKAVHLVWNKNTGLFVGINTFGIRMRHAIFDNWLNKGTSIDEVVSNLKSANFDPEFYANYEQEIIQSFNNKTGKNIKLKPKVWWKKLITVNE